MKFKSKSEASSVGVVKGGSEQEVERNMRKFKQEQEDKCWEA
jgi:hypothetical protein